MSVAHIMRPITIVMICTGSEEYVEELEANVTRLRRIGFTGKILAYVDPIYAGRQIPAIVTGITEGHQYPPAIRQKLNRAAILSQIEDAYFCYLDTDAYVVDMRTFEQVFRLLDSYQVCAPIDPRGKLETELAVAKVNLSGQQKADMALLPGSHTLWCSGVVFGTPSARCRRLFCAWYEINRSYAEAGYRFRDQLSMMKAAFATGIHPFTLGPHFNAMLPGINDPVIVHTKRYGQFYGISEGTGGISRLERMKWHLRLAMKRALRM